MKKKIFKAIAWLFVKLSKLDIIGFGAIVRQLYQTIRQEEFVLTHKVVHVKKGKIKYDLLILETSVGYVKFNLGRHQEMNDCSYGGDPNKRQLHNQTVTN